MTKRVFLKMFLAYSNIDMCDTHHCSMIAFFICNDCFVLLVPILGTSFLGFGKKTNKRRMATKGMLC